ncbi:MAG: dehydrogenase maturation factor [Solirubrobacteraceae bacterium]|jgi:CO dehydrogenase maturation factor|nr:dehydrogenase maturation factor [Solirubrobacteraceae bacterium]
MKIAVSGKGGAGKTTISGTIARALARAGQDVIAIDADVNPMLGISLGLGMDGTERLAGMRQLLSESGNSDDAVHEHTIEGLIERFGEDAPDGVRIVVASRVDMPDHGCLCCGVSADRLLREMEGDGRTVVGDLEAGVGVLSRMEKGSLDVVLVVANPTPKSIEVARRAVETAVAREIRVLVIANRVADDEDLAAIAGVLGEHDIVVVPEDPVIARADAEGLAPIDLDDASPGVRAIIEISERLVVQPV